MALLKKYINFLFIIGLCFHSTNTLTCDIPVPGFEETQVAFESGSSFLKNISEAAANNPVLVAVPTALTTVVLLFAGSGMHAKAKGAYAHLKKEMEQQVANAEQRVDNSVSPTTKRLLMAVLKPCLGGVPNYLKYNKWHIAVAAILSVAGKVFGYPIPFAGAGGIALTAGYFGQGFVEVKQDIDDLRKENAASHAITHTKLVGLEEGQKATNANIEESAAALQQQAEENKKELVDKITNEVSILSTKMETVKTAIGQQITALSSNLDSKVESLDVQIKNLNEQLKDVPKTIGELLERVKVIDKKDGERDKKAEELFLELQKATNNYLSAKQNFDTWIEKLTSQMKKLAEETKQQLEAIQLQTISQAKSLDNLQKRGQLNFETLQQMQLKLEVLQKEMQLKFEALFENTTKNNQLLEVLQQIQKSNGEQLIDLFAKVNASEQRDKETLNVMNTIMQSQEESSAHYATIITNLNEAQKGNVKSMDEVCSKITQLEIALTLVNERINKMDERVTAIQQQVKEGNENLERRLENTEKVNKQKRKKLKKLLQESNSKITELSIMVMNLTNSLSEAYKILNKKMDENKDVAVDTNSMIKKAMLPVDNGLPAQTSGDYVELSSGRCISAAPTYDSEQFSYDKKKPLGSFSRKLPSSKQLPLARGAANSSDPKKNDLATQLLTGATGAK